MSSVTAETVMQKYKVLPESSQREVVDLIDILHKKCLSRKKNIDKKKLLEISQWTDEDIKAIEEAGKEINQWQLETF